VVIPETVPERVAHDWIRDNALMPRRGKPTQTVDPASGLK
jgi:hypothetical protein